MKAPGVPVRVTVPLASGVAIAYGQRVAVEVGVVARGQIDRDVSDVLGHGAAKSSSATGASLTAVTVTVTVAVSVPPCRRRRCR